MKIEQLVTGCVSPAAKLMLSRLVIERLHLDRETVVVFLKLKGKVLTICKKSLAFRKVLLNILNSRV